MMKGFITTRDGKDGTKRYDATWRVDGRQKSKTFPRRKDAERFLADIVGKVHDRTYIEIRPRLMGEVFDEWQSRALAVRIQEGSLKRSTAKAYRSMLDGHLRPAFATVRSDHLTLARVEQWRAGLAAQIAAGTMAPKFSVNLRNLLSGILRWARHPDRRYLTHDPLDGLDRLRLPKAKTRPHYEPEQVATLLREAAQAPPNDTIINTALFSGVRRGELFGLQWPDIEAGTGHGGRLHVRRSIYDGQITSPKTEDSARVIDIPQRLLDDLAIYKVMYPPIGAGFIFRTATGQPIDPSRWHRDHLVPLLERAGLRRPGTGLHSLRHTYVSLLAAQGATVRYVADQVGHSTTRLTLDVYSHTFSRARVEAMQQLGAAIPSSGHPASEAERAETSPDERTVQGAARVDGT
jgi:integrase